MPREIEYIDEKELASMKPFWFAAAAAALLIVAIFVWWLFRSGGSTLTGGELLRVETAEQAIIWMDQVRRNNDQSIYNNLYACADRACAGGNEGVASHRDMIALLWAQSELAAVSKNAEVKKIYHQNLAELRRKFEPVAEMPNTGNPEEPPVTYIWQYNDFHCLLLQFMLENGGLDEKEKDFVASACIDADPETYGRAGDELSADTWAAQIQSKLDNLAGGADYDWVNDRAVSQFLKYGLDPTTVELEMIYGIEEPIRAAMRARYRPEEADDGETWARLDGAVTAYWFIHEFRNPDAIDNYQLDGLLKWNLETGKALGLQTDDLEMKLSEGDDYRTKSAYLQNVWKNGQLAYWTGFIALHNGESLRDWQEAVMDYYGSEVNNLLGQGLGLMMTRNQSTGFYLVRENGMAWGLMVQ